MKRTKTTQPAKADGRPASATLKPKDRAQVAAIAAQLKRAARAKAMRRKAVLLFAGESGVIAAKALAKELRCDLCPVDLSAVISKYIGETEKNLDRLFDTAGDSAVLFFDEADALFGKRSDVKDSHDRYSNVEVAYLLQRLEAFRGIAVFATALKRNIDPAFLRRLRVYEFPPKRAVMFSRTTLSATVWPTSGRS